MHWVHVQVGRTEGKKDRRHCIHLVNYAFMTQARNEDLKVNQKVFLLLDVMEHSPEALGVRA